MGIAEAKMNNGLIIAGLVFGCLALLFVANYLAPWLARKVAERRLQALCRRERAVILTYDDGPGEALTAALLNLLDEQGVRATFYMLGERVMARPEVVRAAIARGHDVGAHGARHVNAWYTSPQTTARDFAAGRATIESIGGNGNLFRPPYGKLTLLQWRIERRLGSKLGWWTIDSRDSWARRPIDEVVAEVVQSGGGVVLMHDFDRYAGTPPGVSHHDHVLTLTQHIIAAARANDLRIMPMSALQAT